MNSDTIYSVSQLNNSIGHFLENKFGEVFVRGEISSFRLYDSGHAYFTLKDKASIINCVYFNYNKNLFNSQIRENIEVVVFGNINIYKARGSMQVVVSNIHIGKEGDLWQNYLKLKDKLNKEGLFDVKYKKDLPSIPSKIAIVSSKEGAVIHDILNILYRRAPYIEVDIKHSLVQGEKSCNSIIRAIEESNKDKKIDLIILARGGGSLEDLMSFNDESVVRAIFNSKLPIITAIGHETDFTLSDFVADKRSATPSEAAEICAPDIKFLYKKINSFKEYILLELGNTLKEKNNFINTSYLRISSKNPKLNLDFYAENLTLNYKLLKTNLIDKISSYENILKKYKNKIQKYDIEAIKDRGFFIVKKNKKILKSINEIDIGDEVFIDLKDGKAKVIVNKIYGKEKNK